MKISDIRDYGFEPDKVSMTNIFSVNEKNSKNGNVITFFNLNDGVVVDGIEQLNSENAKEYICRNGDNLRFISFREYGSIHYWWLIAKVNKIYDCFEKLEAGRKIYLLSKEEMNWLYNLIINKDTSHA